MVRKSKSLTSPLSYPAATQRSSLKELPNDSRRVRTWWRADVPPAKRERTKGHGPAVPDIAARAGAHVGDRLPGLPRVPHFDGTVVAARDNFGGATANAQAAAAVNGVDRRRMSLDMVRRRVEPVQVPEAGGEEGRL